MAALCEDNGEDGVGTAAGLIHVGGGHSPGGGGGGGGEGMVSGSGPSSS